MGMGVILTKGHIRLADIAKAAGVSQGTASNVFSRPEIVREEVRERVLGIARELGYGGPDMKGRLLRAGRVNAIGVAAVEPLAYFFDDPWARALMTSIGRVCDATGTGIALVSAKNQQRLAWNINSALVDGFILLCVDEGERLVELTRQRQLPFIALALGSDDRSVPAIGIANKAGAAAASRHLLELGHRRLAVLTIGHLDDVTGEMTAPDFEMRMKSSTQQRMLGYWQAMAEFGVGRADVPVHATLNDRASVETALAALFDAPAPPTALLAMSDRIALLTLEWLQQRGIAVPRDVSVVGFDGVPEAAAARPPLTTVTQPLDEIARRAVSAILDNAVLASRDALDVELVVRGSTAPPR